MTNLKEKNTKQGNSINEEENFANKQKQQLENSTSNIQDTRNKVTNAINEYQNINNETLQKSIGIGYKYQEQTVKVINSISNNSVELQKNILITYQSVLSKFIDDTFNNKSYWNKFIYPQKYIDLYNNTNNNNITDNTVVNATERVHDGLSGYTELVNKSMEIAQNYYNNSVQNFFSFVNKFQKSYNY